MKRLDKRPSLYLIRHCSTCDSEEKRYSGRETPLNSKGKKEFDMRGKFPKIIPSPGGETLEHLQKRTLEALKEIIASNYQGKTLIVAHGGNIHTLWMFLLNVDLNDFWDFSKINKIECASIYLLENAKGLLLKRNSVSLVKI